MPVSGGIRTLLSSSRLDLVPMTPALLVAEHEGPAALAAGLGVPLPDSWPPELYDDDDLRRFEDLLANPLNAG
jgi:hypothetical protein